MTLDEEIRARLINVETKINRLLDKISQSEAQAKGILPWAGHGDQIFGHLTYAQHGEDLIIAAIFHKLGIPRPSYLDIGAHHPLNISNTALFYSRGSRGINVEANPDLIEAFHKYRPEDKNLNIGIAPQEGLLPFYRIDKFSGRNSFDLKTIQEFTKAHPQFKLSDTIEVPVTTLNKLIVDQNGGVFPDMLSIDVEGLDFDILSGADFSSTRPSILCVEVISGSNSNQSEKTVQMLKDKGFEIAFSTPGNIIFAEASLTPKINALC